MIPEKVTQLGTWKGDAGINLDPSPTFSVNEPSAHQSSSKDSPMQ